jgi:hypothetical protein
MSVTIELPNGLEPEKLEAYVRAAARAPAAIMLAINNATRPSAGGQSPLIIAKMIVRVHTMPRTRMRREPPQPDQTAVESMLMRSTASASEYARSTNR